MAPTPHDMYPDEKAASLGAPAMAPSAPKQRSTVRRALRWVVLGAVLLQGALWLYPEAIAGAAREVLDALEDLAPVGGAAGEGLCVQEDALTPTKNGQLWKQLGVTFGTDEFRGKAIEWLGGAVRIPTETYHRVCLPISLSAFER